MAEQSWVGRGDFYQVVKSIENGMAYAGITCELVSKIVREVNEVHIAFLTFEKFYLRNDSRVSLSVMISEHHEQMTVDAASSGGGESVLFRFDWGSSKNFINSLSQIMSSLGFTSTEFI
ncbi:MAG: DUF6054 family protein [Acholeplasmataceae bacterium]|jgi:hypothetical protein|nr:DUF6054 family protein [Acholeplasmataceae bacterium]